MSYDQKIYNDLNNNKHINPDYISNYAKYLKKYALIDYNIDVQQSFKNLQISKFYKLTGRIMYYRKLGKVRFMDLHNYGESIQLMFTLHDTEDFNYLNYVARGDIIYVEGCLGTSKNKVLSLIVNKWGLVSKTIMEHPDKVGGIKELSVYSNKRYLELIYNTKLAYNLRMRSLILYNLRQFLHTKGYLEIEPPILDYNYGGAAAKPFKTTINQVNKEAYLSVSPEFNLKDLIFAGWQKVYAISKCFRNEGIDPTHHPEFTMLEFYAQNHDYKYMAKMTINLVIHLTTTLKGTSIILHGENTIFLEKYVFVSYSELLARYCPMGMASKESYVLKYLDKTWLTSSLVAIQYEIFDRIIVPLLIQPHIVTDFPAFSTPLAKYNRNNRSYLEQCEIYVAGFELANIYSEENNLHELLDKPQKHSLHNSHIEMLAYGQYIHGGAGIGIDRLIMLLLNEPYIKNVLHTHL